MSNILYDTIDTPTLADFHRSDAFGRGIRGPIGSGKSCACCEEILMRALRQAPSPDGVRRSRFAAVRNTFRQLRSTTINTWQEWIPERVCPIVYSSPIEGHMIAPGIDPETGQRDGTTVDMEMLFFSMDRPKDVRNVLSLELTGVWINEAREIPKVIVDACASRVGRYPRDVVPTWSGIILDTNPPDDDHWWYHAAEEGAWDATANQLTFDIEELSQFIDEDALKIVKAEALKFKDTSKNMRWDWFSQPGALIKLPNGKGYTINPAAENVKNLKLGYMYYMRQIAGKDPEWIRVYLEGKYGSVFDGKPVYHGVWNDEVHVSERPLSVYRNIPLILGWDFGLTPACVVCQLSPRGQFRVLREYVCERGGIRQFATNVVKPSLVNEFKGLEVSGWSDPAGAQASQVDETTPISELNRLGFPTELAPSNDFSVRRQAVMSFLMRMIDGKPGFLLDPSCKMLRKGFNGGYQLARLQITGEEERYHDAPVKNKFSHPAEALQYSCLGVDASIIRKGRGSPARPEPANPWGGFQ